MTPTHWPSALTTHDTSILSANHPAPTITITVGFKGHLEFSLGSVNATIGTVILFNFLSLNHTLTQSELSNLYCVNRHFDTGFKQFNPSNTSSKFLVQYQVTSIKPQWFFCAQTVRVSHY